MKRSWIFLLAVFFLISFFFVSVNPVVIFLAKRQFKSVFKESEVSLQGCRLDPLNRLSLLGLEIKNNQVYDFRVREVRIEYSLFSIFKREILNICLKDAFIYLSLPQKNISEFSKYFTPGKGSAFRVNSLELSDINLNLTAKDLNARIVLSSRINLAGQSLYYLDIKAGLFSVAGVELNDVSFKIADSSPGGYLEIARAKYDKLKIAGVRSMAKLYRNELFLDNFSAKALDGNIDGDLNFKFDKLPVYSAQLEFINLDIARFIDDFNLQDKFEMTGRLNGKLRIAGEGSRINLLGGDFFSLQDGGVLLIKDKRFLENMARNTNQSLNLLVESFQNYHYNTGRVKLFLDKEDVVLDAVLGGELGKRNLEIRLHDFKE